MTRIALKTLQLPGLDDKVYVVPEVSISDPNNDGNVELLFKLPPVIITFSITYSYDGKGLGTYQAEEGMTWGEWVNSPYNTEGFYLGGNGVQPAGSSYGILGLNSGRIVMSTDVIISGNYSTGY